MPSYKLTGYHSHRHPFLGFDDIEDPIVALADADAALANIDVALAGAGNEGNIVDLDNPLMPGVYEALSADPPANDSISIGKVLRPFISGVTSGLIVYGLARTYKVDKKKAKQVSLVFGGVGILFGLASDYIYREMTALVNSQKGTSQ